MANEMHRQFKAHCGSDSDYSWNPKKMHIYCFCHKLALIVGSGLTALGLKTPPPRKIKTAHRGQFPSVAATLAEEEEDGEPGGLEEDPNLEAPTSKQPAMDDQSDIEHDLQDVEDDEDAEIPADAQEADIDDEDDWDAADAEDEGNVVVILEDTVAPTHRREANKLNFILQKVCVSV